METNVQMETDQERANRKLGKGETQIITKHDGTGSTFDCGQGEFKGQILEYPSAFRAIPKLLYYLNEDFTPRPDDVWLLTYPKAGTHWMREIISLLQSGELILESEGKKANDILEINTDVSKIDEMPSPRLLNTHIAVEYLPQQALKNSKVIYAARNPKSTSVSFYHMHRNMKLFKYAGDFKGYQDMYNSDKGQYSLYGSWFEHLLTHSKTLPNACFVYYEELLKKPVEGIQKIADYLGLDRDVEFCRAVAEKTSFDSMAKGNKKGTIFRKGRIDDWKNHFTVAQNDEFDAIYSTEMKSYPELKEHIVFE